MQQKKFLSAASLFPPYGHPILSTLVGGEDEKGTLKERKPKEKRKTYQWTHFIHRSKLKPLTL